MIRAVGRAGPGLALAVVLLAAQGCTNWQGGVAGFLRNRAKDAMECADIGITISDRAQGCFYAAFMSAVPFGYGEVDGTFFGLGGGDFGAMRIHYRHWGLGLIGREEVAWGNSIWDFPEFDPDTPDDRMNCQGVGILGFFTPPYDARPAGRPT
ncbi:MAG TPA: hypothetical protein PLE19_00670 [Planctomycetota bacterium]|nr:hypothetical protein [Planctomycetota bacterium]HRR79660.1 hypothetical protein [Planctomycetota bacterium]HRT93668.1 hypothetical protein [Planctomycetota bacterium]